MGTGVSGVSTTAEMPQIELEVLRAVANGRVSRSAYGDVYLRDGATVPLPWVRVLVECELSKRITFTTDAYPSGVAQRAELTVAGFARVDQLARELKHQPARRSE